MKHILLLLRISKPQYNEDLYLGHKVYMNPQLSFNEGTLLNGQIDKAEGLLSDSPAKLFYSPDDGNTWNYLADTKEIRKNNNAYIYCMYAVLFEEGNFDRNKNKYYCNVPWEFIKDVWQDGYEMMVIKNTSQFLNLLHEAASEKQLSHAYGLIKYDLQEKKNDRSYMVRATADPFQAVFHKYGETYSIQNEFRFVVKPTDNPDHYELPIEPDPAICVSIVPLKRDRDILIELSDLKFGTDRQPIQFSPKIVFYESSENTAIESSDSTENNGQ